MFIQNEQMTEQNILSFRAEHLAYLYVNLGQIYLEFSEMKTQMLKCKKKKSESHNRIRALAACLLLTTIL